MPRGVTGAVANEVRDSRRAGLQRIGYQYVVREAIQVVRVPIAARRRFYDLFNSYSSLSPSSVRLRFTASMAGV